MLPAERPGLKNAAPAADPVADEDRDSSIPGNTAGPVNVAGSLDLEFGDESA
jgi:hypothetical protein